MEGGSFTKWGSRLTLLKRCEAPRSAKSRNSAHADGGRFRRQTGLSNLSNAYPDGGPILARPTRRSGRT
eukprot:7702302-Pyramimonas_sp.AAC.2